MSSDCGRKPEHPEKETLTDTGRTCRLHTERTPECPARNPTHTHQVISRRQVISRHHHLSHLIILIRRGGVVGKHWPDSRTLGRLHTHTSGVGQFRISSSPDWISSDRLRDTNTPARSPSKALEVRHNYNLVGSMVGSGTYPSRFSGW